MNIQSEDNSLTYSFSNNEVIINFEQVFNLVFYDDRYYDSFRLEIKPLDGSTFSDGIFFSQVPFIIYDRNEDYSREEFFLDENDEEGEEKMEENLEIVDYLGHYLIVTKELEEEDKKEIKRDCEEYGWNFLDVYEQEFNQEYLERYQFFGKVGEKIKIYWELDNKNSVDILEIKRLLEIALKNINEELKQNILSGLPTSGIGDTQKYIISLLNQYASYFERGNDLKKREEREKEEEIKRKLTEFGLNNIDIKGILGW